MRGVYNNKNVSALTKSSSIFLFKFIFDLLVIIICAEVITLYFPLNIKTKIFPRLPNLQAYFYLNLFWFA
jgi:hypothetical protein